MSRDLLPDNAGFNRCVRAREGYVVYNRNDIYIGQAIEHYGEYGELEAQFLRQLSPPGGTVVEVGANIGTHTLALARVTGPSGWVVAYEPQRIVFQTLCANLALNSIVWVDARQSAVAASSGSVQIPDIDYNRPGNFGGMEVSKFASGRHVPRVTLDSDLDPSRIDLLKVDVEGMELEVLRGADGLLRRFRPLLYVENDRIERSAELIAHLFGLDYRLYWHLPALYNPENFFGAKDNRYPRIVSVNMLGVPRARAQDLKGMPEITDPGQHPMRSAGPAASP